MRRPGTRSRRSPEAAGSRHIPTEMVQEILVKLPTRDVARSCCVSKPWRRVVKDSSFPKLHDAEHAAPSPSPGGAEALLVTVSSVYGGSLHPSIYSVTSSKRMCRLVSESMGAGYVATNVCNGFICFGPAAGGESPAVLCNPATGETLALPGAPPIRFKEMDRYLFLLGFSSGEYKLFRLSFRGIGERGDHYVDVCTLGDSRGWRKQPYLVPLRPVYGVPPVLVDGKLYLLTSQWQFAGHPERILVVDVASEAHCTYRLPKGEYVELRGQALMDVFELHGRLCLAVNYVLFCPDRARPKVEFWVSPRLGQLDGKNHMRLNWKLRYTFLVDVDHAPREAEPWYAWSRQFYTDRARAAWVDQDGMLCYLLGDCLYKYNTSGHRSEPPPDGFVSWHQKVQLPATTSSASKRRRWNIYGGYRPSLLSPLAFTLPSSSQSQVDEDSEAHAIATLHKLRRHDSKRRPSNDSTRDRPAGRKRICHGSNFMERC